MIEQPRLTPDAFEALVPKLRKMKGEMIEVARLVLVDGQSLTKAAQSLGLSKQNASKHMQKVKALMSDVPANWVRFDEWVPAWLAEETRTKLEAEKKKIKNISSTESTGG